MSDTPTTGSTVPPTPPANGQSSEERSIQSWLQELSEQRPRVARALVESVSRRHAAANTWNPGGQRLTGLEQLLQHLDSVSDHLVHTRRERVVARLVQRMTRNFETALEAGLSGYTAVALDAMRDVMEATDLVLMFSTDLALIDEWVQTPSHSHWRKFSPAAVRKHLLRAHLKYTSNAQATVDYRGHSMALHVTPWRIPLADRGIAEPGFLTNDAPFWEIFTHARELVFALDRLRKSAGFDWDGVVEAEDLTDLAKAYERSKEMEAVFLALLQAAADHDDEGQGEAVPEGDASAP